MTTATKTTKTYQRLTETYGTSSVGRLAKLIEDTLTANPDHVFTINLDLDKWKRGVAFDDEYRRNEIAQWTWVDGKVFDKTGNTFKALFFTLSQLPVVFEWKENYRGWQFTVQAA